MKRFLRKYNLVRLFIYTIVLAACFIALSAYFSENNVTTWQQTISSIKTPRYVTCTIQNDVKIPCINESNKIFIPFDFISKKFDLQGIPDDTSATFQLKFTNFKIHQPSGKYDSSKQYLWYDRVNVESRERVKHMSLRYGVPISSQWNKKGHIYPVQVSQFGLSYFSKWVTNAYSSKHQFFFINHSQISLPEDVNTFINPIKHGFEFKTNDKVVYKFDQQVSYHYLSAEIYTNAYMELIVDLNVNTAEISPKHLQLIYSFNVTPDNEHDELIRIQRRRKTLKIRHQLYRVAGEFKLVRNLCIDSCKQVGFKCDVCFAANNSFGEWFQIGRISLTGSGRIKNGLLADECDLKLAEAAGDYLVQSQSKTTGAWLMNVTRTFDKNSLIKIEPGWHSAMAQGQAISLLCRLFNTSGNAAYLTAATSALHIYDVEVENNGVKTFFMNGSNVWFEEYPTRPSLFVLNGFMYSIFGLADYISSCGRENAKAKRLFASSMQSLVNMVNFFDTGSRTLYDLRHLTTNADVNPNVARWDYHALHVSQVYYLANLAETIDPVFFKQHSKLLNQVAVRWHNYIYGIWNQHSQIRS